MHIRFYNAHFQCNLLHFFFTFDQSDDDGSCDPVGVRFVSVGMMVVVIQ